MNWPPPHSLGGAHAPLPAVASRAVRLLAFHSNPEKQMLRTVPLLSLMLCAAVAGHAGESPQFYFPTTGFTVRDEAVLLAIDDVSLPLKANLCTYLTKPTVRKAPVLGPRRDDPKAPDHLAAQFYGTVLFDEGRFRMWYYPVSQSDDAKEILQGPVCYAESKDGIEWTRPDLGQIEYKGSTHYNAIKLPEEKIEGVNVIKDADDPDPQRRYKMVYNPWVGRTFTIQTATSPDGIHWTPRVDYPNKAKFLEQSGFLKFGGLYLIHGQDLGYGEGGGRSGRQGYAWVSADFDHWLAATAEAFALPEPMAAADRGGVKPYDQVHLGVAGANRGNVVVGLYGLWHNQPGTNDPKKKDSWFGVAKTTCDLGLVVSNDGIHFREPVKGHVYISRDDSPVTPLEGKPRPTILIQSTGILNVGDETRIYHGRWRNADFPIEYGGEIALATLPRDRWGALGLVPGKTEGEVWSAVIELPRTDFNVALNAENAGAMRVEFADEQFRPLPGFSGADSGTAAASGGLEHAVHWNSGTPSALGGRKVRLRVQMKKEGSDEPRLYAVYLRGPAQK